MRELDSQDQQSVAGGFNMPSDYFGWVPSNVLFALQTGELGFGPGAISLPIRTPGLIPGPGILPPTTVISSSTYDC